MSLLRISILTKVVRQLGFRQLVHYALYQAGLRTGYFRWMTKGRGRKIDLDHSSSVHDLFPLPDRAQLQAVLGEEGQRRLLAEADEIVVGKIRLFGSEPVELNLKGDWRQVHWTEFETGKEKIDGDIKMVWEPARFGWAYVLGRAFHLAQDERYAEAFWRNVESFLEANPPYLGPHWMNGQEIAIRLMVLLWAHQIFEKAGASTPERRARLVGSIADHAFRIPPTLLYARAQNNNHLITEAAALYGASRALNQPKLRRLGWRWLNRAFRSQISSYGEYIQHSANYHRVMLSAALWVEAVREETWPRLTTQALGRAVHWLYSMLDPSTGQVPNLGANDGALILPLADSPYHDFRPVVQAAARAFLRFQLPSGPWDEASLWFGLPSHTKVYESGLHLSDHLRGRSSWAYLRASSFRSRLGHMDQLHLDLWWRGLNVTQDAGTYLYNGVAPWDNPLVTSLVHNTVTVDNRDQMTRGGRFLTLDWFPAFSKRMIATQEAISGRVLAYHRGYRGVRHSRMVTVFNDERWLVEDTLRSGPPHLYRLHWLLPDWECEIETSDQGAVIRLKSPHGWIKVKVHCPSSTTSIVRAGEVVSGQRDAKPYEGWVSPTYTQKNPALSLAIEVRSERSVQFTTEFIFPT